MINFNTLFHAKKIPEKWIVLFILLLAFSLRLYLSSFDGYRGAYHNIFSIGIWNLGALSSPETTWAPTSSGESFYIDLGDQREIRTIYFLETDA